MRYAKGSFVIVPNKDYLPGLEPYIQAVYFWICSFADENGVCFPSRTTIAIRAGCSVKSVDRAIERLCLDQILRKETRKNEDKNLTNVYQIMIDPWGGDSQSPPRDSQSLGVGTDSRTELYPVLTQPTEISASARDLEKITIVDDSIPRKKEKKRADENILEVFRCFGKYPKNWEANKTERGAAERLLEEHGLENIKKALAFCRKHKDDERFYQVLTPWDLDSKWVKLEAYSKKI